MKISNVLHYYKLLHGSNHRLQSQNRQKTRTIQNIFFYFYFNVNLYHQTYHRLLLSAPISINKKSHSEQCS